VKGDQFYCTFCNDWWTDGARARHMRTVHKGARLTEPVAGILKTKRKINSFSMGVKGGKFYCTFCNDWWADGARARHERETLRSKINKTHHNKEFYVNLYVCVFIKDNFYANSSSKHIFEYVRFAFNL
jgi:predicted metal-binding protein